MQPAFSGWLLLYKKDGGRNMYELYNGSERLMNAIEHRIDDASFMAALADLLYYKPEQLRQDLQALRDRLEETHK